MIIYMSDKDDPSASVQAIAAALAAGAAGVTPIEIAMAASAPALASLVARSIDEVRHWRQRSAELFLHDLSQNLHADPLALIGDANGTSDRRQVFNVGFSAAIGTVHEVKVKALAHAVAEGLLGDEAAVDQAALVVAGLSELDMPHIRVLGRMIEATARNDKRLSLRDIADLVDPKRAPLGVTQTIAATLERLGMTLEENKTWRVSAFGYYCWRYLSSEMSDSPTSL